MKPSVGILALQGAFAEQAAAFREAGAETFEIRSPPDLSRRLDALVLPGGESTVQGRLLEKTGLFGPLADRIRGGLPVFATCAGLILLAERIEGGGPEWFAALPVTVRRNAYGRQLGSFSTIGKAGEDEDVPMTFIRAPAITATGPGVEILSSFGGAPTGVRCGRIAAFAWHPELSADRRVVKRFLSSLGERAGHDVTAGA
ncbi:MAG: pyridoxal 5'-phosphate synthase glutaminase subunit PdxT [Kiritimatiellae bacterium]|nr:pyridoxal 5'-phosphate synthase glutaminase subunit PdxT [Kiritimatiellia bacterium]